MKKQKRKKVNESYNKKFAYRNRRVVVLHFYIVELAGTPPPGRYQYTPTERVFGFVLATTTHPPLICRPLVRHQIENGREFLFFWVPTHFQFQIIIIHPLVIFKLYYYLLLAVAPSPPKGFVQVQVEPLPKSIFHSFMYICQMVTAYRYLWLLLTRNTFHTNYERRRRRRNQPTTTPSGCKVDCSRKHLNIFYWLNSRRPFPRWETTRGKGPPPPASFEVAERKRREFTWKRGNSYCTTKFPNSFNLYCHYNKLDYVKSTWRKYKLELWPWVPSKVILGYLLNYFLWYTLPVCLSVGSPPTEVLNPPRH